MIFRQTTNALTNERLSKECADSKETLSETPFKRVSLIHTLMTSSVLSLSIMFHASSKHLSRKVFIEREKAFFRTTTLPLFTPVIPLLIFSILPFLGSLTSVRTIFRLFVTAFSSFDLTFSLL